MVNLEHKYKKISVDEDTYYTMLRWKADLKAGTWRELVSKVDAILKAYQRR